MQDNFNENQKDSFQNKIKIFDWFKSSFLHPTTLVPCKIVPYMLLLIIIISIFIFGSKNTNNELVNFKIINQLIYKEPNRLVLPYADIEHKNDGFYFIGKMSEFYDLKQNKSTSITALNNMNPIYAKQINNQIVILNKKKNNILEIKKYDLTQNKIIEKNFQIELDNDTSLYIDSPFVDNYEKTYIPIYYDKGTNYIIILDKNFEKYSITENKLQNTRGKILTPDGLSYYINVGGYDKNSKVYSNKIYKTTNFKEEKFYLSTNINENSICFLANYYGIPDKLTGSYYDQEIWIINNTTLTKVNIFTDKIKTQKLPKKFEKAKILTIIQQGNKQLCFIEQEDKIYYFEINNKKNIKIKYLMRKATQELIFATPKFFYTDKKIYIFTL